MWICILDKWSSVSTIQMIWLKKFPSFWLLEQAALKSSDSFNLFFANISIKNLTTPYLKSVGDKIIWVTSYLFLDDVQWKYAKIAKFGAAIGENCLRKWILKKTSEI